jgi:hypothetical protein
MLFEVSGERIPPPSRPPNALAAFATGTVRGIL